MVGPQPSTFICSHCAAESFADEEFLGWTWLAIYYLCCLFFPFFVSPAGVSLLFFAWDKDNWEEINN